jgi:hypothetical protein
MIFDKNVIRFSTGRVADCHYGIIGLDVKTLQPFEGYENPLRPISRAAFGDIGYNFTQEERDELADYMIGLWTKYKEYR